MMGPRLATADAWGIPAMPQASLRRNGWGDAQDVAKGVQVGSSLVSPVVAGVVGSHAASIVAATGAPAFFALPAVAVPLIGAALVGATILITTLIRNSGCGQTCVVTSQWANDAAQALQANLDAYRNGPRNKEAQAVALANFDAIWQALKQQCGQPGTGDAGKRCISDRQRGACTWKDNGECWDWFRGYRDEIANDPNVRTSGGVTDIFDAGQSGDSAVPVLGAIGLLLLGAWLL